MPSERLNASDVHTPEARADGSTASESDRAYPDAVNTPSRQAPRGSPRCSFQLCAATPAINARRTRIERSDPICAGGTLPLVEVVHGNRISNSTTDPA